MANEPDIKVPLVSEEELLLSDDGMCFGCGINNPIGLKLKFHWDGDECYTVFTLSRYYQGWERRVHGGILALVLDEVLSRSVLERHGKVWVTAELNTRIQKPAFVGIEYVASASVEKVRSRLITSIGKIANKDTGEVVATGHIKMMQPKEYRESLL